MTVVTPYGYCRQLTPVLGSCPVHAGPGTLKREKKGGCELTCAQHGSQPHLVARLPVLANLLEEPCVVGTEVLEKTGRGLGESKSRVGGGVGRRESGHSQERRYRGKVGRASGEPARVFWEGREQGGHARADSCSAQYTEYSAHSTFTKCCARQWTSQVARW